MINILKNLMKMCGSFNELLEQLAAGKSISIVDSGKSMRPRIEPGQRFTISPVDPSTVRIDDIVLVRWKKGRYLCHLVMETDGNRFLIGNTWGKINGWVNASDIFGIVINVDNDK